MSITAFIPEIWSAQLLVSLKKSLVFAGCCNRDYEGEIAQSGDTVHITSISRPTVAPYVKDTTVITPETLSDAQKSLVVDQVDYFAFEIDDIDMRQAKSGGALLAGAAVESAYAIAEKADRYVRDAHAAGADAANKVAATSRATAALCVEGLLDLKTILDGTNTPQEGRYVIMPPWAINRMLLDTRFVVIDAYASGGAGFRNGQIGKCFGFDVVLSNNCALSDGVNDSMVYAGHPSCCTFADQINKVEAYRPQSSFSDALKGLHLYGAKVTRPASCATSVFSQT